MIQDDKQQDVKNVYLEQVQAKQQQLEQDLRAQRAPAAAMAAPETASRARLQFSGPPLLENLSQAVNVRIVGLWRWKTVIVPPNAYVVHTRRGQTQPVHLGLGVSFRFNPYTDSFLAVPSTMQTILINAYSICQELQGLLVQGYVQWIIADFGTAYKKLDFTDVVDPMRVVNLQLREQAEAAIKDKVATMSIHDVLSDKQPIIQELTARLRHVAEGEGDEDKGLGLRIVTVQIKEAVVSSARLWENLQKPFRSEREQIARLAELSTQSVIQTRELEHEKEHTTAQLESESEIALLRSSKEAASFDREQAERSRRHKKEQEAMRQTIEERNATAKHEQQAKREFEESLLENNLAVAAARLEAKQKEILKDMELRIDRSVKEAETVKAESQPDRARLEKEAEFARLRLEEELAAKEASAKAELALKEAAYSAANRQTEAEIEFEAARQKILNELSQNHLGAKLIEALPAVAEKLPKPDHMRSISIGSAADSNPAQALTSLVAQLLAVLDAFRSTSGTEKN